MEGSSSSAKEPSSSGDLIFLSFSGWRTAGTEQVETDEMDDVDDTVERAEEQVEV